MKKNLRIGSIAILSSMVLVPMAALFMKSGKEISPEEISLEEEIEENHTQDRVLLKIGESTYSIEIKGYSYYDAKYKLKLSDNTLVFADEDRVIVYEGDSIASDFLEEDAISIETGECQKESKVNQMLLILDDKQKSLDITDFEFSTAWYDKYRLGRWLTSSERYSTTFTATLTDHSEITIDLDQAILYSSDSEIMKEVMEHEKSKVYTKDFPSK